jgi:ribonuclease D
MWRLRRSFGRVAPASRSIGGVAPVGGDAMSEPLVRPGRDDGMSVAMFSKEGKRGARTRTSLHYTVMSPLHASTIERSEEPLPYLATPEAVEDFMRSITPTPILALDTEGASFHRFVDRIYLLQLSTVERSAIIDPLGMSAPPGLGVVLEDPSVEVIFHDADYDLRLLHQDYGWHVRNIFDTRIAAQLLGIRAFGLAALLERYFDVKLEKKHQRADWSMRPLTQDMLDYAAQDTKYLIELRNRMRADLENAGRWSWAEEEFRRLEGTRWTPDEEIAAFLRMKGARDLNRRELGVLREIVAWRDMVAGDIDRATFRVMSNDVLLEVARIGDASREALAAIKGMPRSLLERRGGELIDAVRRGLAVPDAELPRFPRPARFERDPDFEENVARLRAARDEAAARLDLDPGVLCSRDRLEMIARMQPESVDRLAEIRELRRWQIAELGEQFVSVFAGSSAEAATPAEEPDSPYAE